LFWPNDDGGWQTDLLDRRPDEGKTNLISFQLAVATACWRRRNISFSATYSNAKFKHEDRRCIPRRSDRKLHEDSSNLPPPHRCRCIAGREDTEQFDCIRFFHVSPVGAINNRRILPFHFLARLVLSFFALRRSLTSLFVAMSLFSAPIFGRWLNSALDDGCHPFVLWAMLICTVAVRYVIHAIGHALALARMCGCLACSR
jgi:hypothetical protein